MNNNIGSDGSRTWTGAAHDSHAALKRGTETAGTASWIQEPARSSGAPAGERNRTGKSFEARLLRRLLSGLGNPPIEFELQWSGERIAADTSQPPLRVRIADPRTVFGLLRDPMVHFGDAYSCGRIEVAGDLVQFMGMVFRNVVPNASPPSIAKRIAGWLYHPRRNTLEGSRANIHRHYDLGNEFYSLWLGDTMAYTCAYYETAQATLDQAQTAKMDHVCRKLRLSARDSVVEAGCGWGGLALHIASRYGAKVRAYNISREQLDFARHRARKWGLEHRVEFIEDDYRNITDRCDVFVSVGMLEHVGRENYAELGRVARRLLIGEGRGLIHSIGRNRPEPFDAWTERRIFPGAYPPSLGEMMQIFEPSNLSVLDVENLRLHYALTLRHWLQLYEAAVEKLRTMSFDETFIRMWRMYLAGSIAAFEAGSLQLFQVLFTTQENNSIPLTRRYIYQD